MDDLITTREVARLAGVGPTAVKRWADALLLRAVRTVGGHRRFRRSEVERFLHQRGAPTPGPEQSPRSLADLLLRTGDVHGIQGVLLAERSRLGGWWRAADLVGEALRELGEGWARGEVSVGEEHLASERLARALARLADALPDDPDAARCLLVTVDGDDHTLGLSLAQLVLHEAGWASAWAGRATPPAEIQRLLAGAPGTPAYAMLGVSASVASQDQMAMARAAQQLGELCAASGVTLVLGGSGGWPERPTAGVRLRTMEAFHRFALEERRRRLEGPLGA